MLVYKITNKLNGMCYVGQTTQSLLERWRQHCLPSNRSKRIRNAIQKYGQNNFYIETLGTYDSREDLNNAEEYFVDWFNCVSPNGYNLQTGGDAPIMSEETRQRISQAKLGPKNPMFGGNFSKEHLRRMSESQMGRTSAMKGRNHSAATRAKMSLAQSGPNNANYGKKMSVTRKKILSAAHLKYYKQHPEKLERLKSIGFQKGMKTWNVKDLDVGQIKKDYLNHVPVKTIAKKFNVEASAIYRRLKKLGITRSSGDTNKGRVSEKRIKIKCITTGEIFESIAEAELKLGVDSRKISAVAKGKRRHTGGFKFQYLEKKVA